jgi:hypothetical protein
MEFITATVRQRQASIALATVASSADRSARWLATRCTTSPSRWMRPFTSSYPAGSPRTHSFSRDCPYRATDARQVADDAFAVDKCLQADIPNVRHASFATGLGHQESGNVPYAALKRK